MNIYQEVVKFINSFQQGETFTTLQFHNHMAKLGYRDSYQPHYRINTYRTYLRSAGFVANTSRGKWIVLHRIPSWATLSALEIARGYKGTEAQRKAVRANIAQYKQAGAQPTLAFKIGDKVQVGNDQTIYTIEQHPTRENAVNITWMDPSKGKQSVPYGKAKINEYLTKKNPHWKLVTPKTPSFKVGDKVRLIDGKIKSAAQESWIQSDNLKRNTTYTVATVMEESSGDVIKVRPEHEARGVYWIRMDSFVPAPVEKPKPVETKKPRLMLCVDMSDSPADYTVGKVYELSNEDDDYYYFKRNDRGVGGGGMFKYRFKEIKDEVANSVKVLCINNFGGYEDLLTVGKIYEAVPSKDGEKCWTIPVSDDGAETGAYKHRFTVLTETTTKREWKVGDTITSKFLNDSKIEKEFHGYDAGWNIYAHRSFMRDRTVEVIQEREGKRAARISGTMDIWITLESLELHP